MAPGPSSPDCRQPVSTVTSVIQINHCASRTRGLHLRSRMRNLTGTCTSGSCSPSLPAGRWATPIPHRREAKPLGDGFIALVKMLISPIIFCTVVLGIAGAGDMKKVGRVGGKALIYFELVSTVALIIGLVVINVVRPGAGSTSIRPRSTPRRWPTTPSGPRRRAPSTSSSTSSRPRSSTPSPARVICCRCCSCPCCSATR